MVRYCSVPQCTSYATERGVSFHIYPKDPKLKKKWIVKLGMGKRPTPSSTVCSKNFVDSDFCYPPCTPLLGYRIRRLTLHAVPSQNLPRRPLDKDPKTRPPNLLAGLMSNLQAKAAVWRARNATAARARHRDLAVTARKAEEVSSSSKPRSAGQLNHSEETSLSSTP
nr:THAP domain-containing protein 2-like [Rhipicephalus microplus]